MAQQPVPMGQTNYYDPATAMAQASGVIPGQPMQQVFQNPTQQMPPPASTVQAMQQQAQQNQYQQVPVQPVYQAAPAQGTTMSMDEFNRQVDELAENKFKVRAQEVINNAYAAVKGVLQMNQQQAQQPYYPQQMPMQQQSCWVDTAKQVGYGGIGAALVYGGVKLVGKLFGGNNGNGYTPSGAEFARLAEAGAALFGK